ncbi:hypothetical protein M8J75_014616 [Diaphorina citri]|nr:hypothetical protein M8J75_014616 [Diaphorina citri]KAI5737940.1 hypothetical protein M8J77_000974 [Diaphorina citri]
MSAAVQTMGMLSLDGDYQHSMAMYLYASRISAAFRCFPMLNGPPSPTPSDDIRLTDVTSEQPSTSSSSRCHRHCCHRNHHRHKHKVYRVVKVDRQEKLFNISGLS